MSPRQSIYLFQLPPRPSSSNLLQTFQFLKWSEFTLLSISTSDQNLYPKTLLPCLPTFSWSSLFSSARRQSYLIADLHIVHLSLFYPIFQFVTPPTIQIIPGVCFMYFTVLSSFPNRIWALQESISNLGLLLCNTWKYAEYMLVKYLFNEELFTLNYLFTFILQQTIGFLKQCVCCNLLSYLPVLSAQKIPDCLYEHYTVRNITLFWPDCFITHITGIPITTEIINIVYHLYFFLCVWFRIVDI